MNITTDDLELLAKTAGIREEHIEIHKGEVYYVNVNTVLIKFEPHEDQNQVALVLKGLSEEQRVAYGRKLWDECWVPNVRWDMQPLAQELPAETSTKLLLEVLK